MATTKQIKKWLLDHPINEQANDKYADAYTHFRGRVTKKQLSNIWRQLQKIQNYISIDVNEVSGWAGTGVEAPAQNTKTVSAAGDKLNITIGNVDHEVKTLDDLLAVCEVDTREWEVLSWQCKKWDLGIKNANDAIETKQLFSVSAKFKQRKVDTDLNLQKEVILKELFSQAPNYKPISKTEGDVRNYAHGKLLELALFDVHFGKLAHREEVGEDYDLKIASARYEQAIQSLLSRVNLASIGRILFPVGQDLINVDNLSSTTTAGTPQDCDSRFHKIIKTVKELLIKTILELSTIAPVDVVVTPGNHDTQTSFMIGEILEAYFNKDTNVTVFNAPTPRKFYQFGDVAIMYSHGDKEKFNELGMVFAAENPKLWGNTSFRYIHVGHRHCTKLQVMQKDEHQGFQTQIIPSLSSTDSWHAGRAYKSLKQAKAFIYDKKEGQIGEFTFTAK
jgi:hypothetical protein